MPRTATIGDGRLATARPARASLAARASGLDKGLDWLLLAAAGLIATGWLVPAMTVSQFFFFEEAVSLAGGMRALLAGGEYVLVALITLFALVLPVSRLGLIFYLWRFHRADDPRLRRRLRLIQGLGKWSMLDVFLMALVVAALNISLIAEVHVRGGVYALAGGVLLSMLAASRLAALCSPLGDLEPVEHGIRVGGDHT